MKWDQPDFAKIEAPGLTYQPCRADQCTAMTYRVLDRAVFFGLCYLCEDHLLTRAVTRERWRRSS